MYFIHKTKQLREPWTILGDPWTIAEEEKGKIQAKKARN